MTARGRPRKPLPERLLEGSYRADRHGNPDEVWLPDGLPTMPDWLDGDAKLLWQSLLPELKKRGVATEVDAAELAGMCDWWARYRQAARALNELNPKDEGYYSLSMLCGMAWKNFSAASAKFGLNPSDRAKLRLEATPKSEDELLNFSKRKT